MPDLRTTITEVVTGLATFGASDVGTALQTLTSAVENVSPELWSSIRDAWDGDTHSDAFHDAWCNGTEFSRARDGLRGRRPRIVEWKGLHKAPGDEVVPADLRIDHVYQVSCKYLSKIVVNASPAHVFERLLTGGHGQRSGDWFQQVAPRELDAFYTVVREESDLALPATASELTVAERKALAISLRGTLSTDARKHYEELAPIVARESARVWSEAIAGDEERMLWRMLRIGSAPYFVLGASKSGPLRMRVGTPWDWRQRFTLSHFGIEPRDGGQPMVGWCADVRDKKTGAEHRVDGHVQIRWSHGRFCGPPEAKVYLDTPHTEIPGYFTLE